MIISFLDTEDLSGIKRALGEISIEKSEFFGMVSLKLFIRSFLNYTDRSVYLSFYADPEYLRIEDLHINTLSYELFNAS